MEKGVMPVGVFTASYLLIAAYFAVTLQNWEFVFYIAVTLALIFFAFTVHRHVHFTIGTLWALSVWGMLHMMGGLMPVPTGIPYEGQPVFYSMWIIPEYLKYDMIIHAFGFGVATFACWQTIVVVSEQDTIRPGRVILAILAGMGLGATNEVIEFAATLIMTNTNVGGYENTGWDLVSNMVGCIIAGLYILRSWEPEKKYLRSLIKHFRKHRR